MAGMESRLCYGRQGAGILGVTGSRTSLQHLWFAEADMVAPGRGHQGLPLTVPLTLSLVSHMALGLHTSPNVSGLI